MVSCSNHYVGRWWKHFVIILTPVLLLLQLLTIPESTIPWQANKCLYVMVLMAVYWCTEVLSLAVTACIPIFIFPMFGILTTATVCSQYLSATIMMFVGGIMVALAVEKCNLHKRIAISVLHLVGTKPLWLMLGFMLPTAVLSMWISNTATTAMMLPISEAVLQSLQETHEKKKLEEEEKSQTQETELGADSEGHVNKAFKRESVAGTNFQVDEEQEPTEIFVPERDDGSLPEQSASKSKYLAENNTSKEAGVNSQPESQAQSGYKTTGDAKLDKFAKGMTLAVAYAANTGGTATLIGTPPNTILKGHADEIWERQLSTESPITFTSWLVVGMPVAITNFIIVWLWLTVFFNGFRSLGPSCQKDTEDDRSVRKVIEKEYKSLSKISFAEVAVSVMFSAMVLLWFFRAPSFMTGWAELEGIKPGYTHDAVVSIFITFILCVIPNKLPTCRKDDTGPVETLLDWRTIQTRIPWGVVFLIGGGLSLAKASTESGLSAWIADRLAAMSGWNSLLVVFALSLITAFLTEVTSNSATCTILMPIVSSLAISMGYNPLYLMIPAGLSTSFAFMLPVATPPNAIAFSFGRLKILDMALAGFILNFTCVGMVTLSVHTWAGSYFKLTTLPWANNATSTK